MNLRNGQGNPIEQAQEYWRCGKALEAGRIIFENMPVERRASWVSGILKLAVGKSSTRYPSVERLVYIADRAAEWPTAREAFRLLRKSTLELEGKCRTQEQTLHLRLLYLSENVAKVIYNLTDPSDPFDEDAGWWIASCLKSILESFNDDNFSRQAWSALSSIEG